MVLYFLAIAMHLNPSRAHVQFVQSAVVEIHDHAHAQSQSPDHGMCTVHFNNIFVRINTRRQTY